MVVTVSVPRIEEIRRLLSPPGQIGDAECAWLVAIARDLLAALAAAEAEKTWAYAKGWRDAMRQENPPAAAS